jgi:hypothetical protein
MLLLALIGFAGTTVAGLAIALASANDAFAEAYLQASGPLATWAGVNRIEPSPENRLFMLLLSQALCGLVVTALAHGTMTCLALQGRATRLGTACRMAATRLPALLAGTVLFSASGQSASMPVCAMPDSISATPASVRSPSKAQGVWS